MTLLPNNLYKVAQIRELERLTVDVAGITEQQLMERAGAAALRVLREHWPQAKTVAVLCGTGNNGGDGYVVAHLAHQQGLQVTIWHMGELQQLNGIALQAAQACQALGIPIQPFNDERTLDADVIVDALLGIGTHDTLNEQWQQAVCAINASKAGVLAIDLPSGLDANTGKILGCAVQATATITFLGLKSGLFTGAAPAYCGAIHYDSLGIPDALLLKISHAAERMNITDLQHFLAPRSRDAHKGDFGHILLVGGDYGMPGAVRLAAEAALRVGAGLVSVATRPEHIAIINTRPEVMCHGIVQATELEPLLQKATVVIIGPGLGRHTWGQSLLEKVLTTTLPLLVDADALSLLASKNISRHNWILTPHPGEAARLLSSTPNAIQADRFTAAQNLQTQYGGVTVLKGAGTVVVGHMTVPGVCNAGNPGMATAGMGDVLSGIIGGLLAQHIPPEMAARLGVCMHATAADRAAVDGERGMLALDLMPHLRQLTNPRY